jgi:hypothetical protein
MDLHYSLIKWMSIPDATSIDVWVEDTSDDEVDTQVMVREPIFLITIKDYPTYSTTVVNIEKPRLIVDPPIG